MTNFPVHSVPPLAAIRPATEDDLPAMEALHDTCSPQALRARYLGVPPRDAIRRLSASCDAFVAHLDGQLVGFGHLALRDHPHGPEAEVSLLIHDDHQRQGHGARLATELARHARQRGARRLSTLTRAGDSAAAALMSRAVGPVSVAEDDGVVTLSCPLDNLHADTN